MVKVPFLISIDKFAGYALRAEETLFRGNESFGRKPVDKKSEKKRKFKMKIKTAKYLKEKEKSVLTSLR